MEVRTHSDIIEPLPDEPEILPQSFIGKWVPWSSDGLRIIAWAESSEEAEGLAIKRGEPDPILHRPMALR